MESDHIFSVGKQVFACSDVDANLFHDDIITRCSITSILHLLSKMPIDWYSKKQVTVETATYGSEFVAARMCVDHVVDLRTTLHYLGISIHEKHYIFGNNKMVIEKLHSTAC